MRLAAKLVLVYLVGLLLIVGVFSYLTVQNERLLAAAYHQHQAAELVAEMRSELRKANASDDPNMVRKVLRRTNSEKSLRMSVRLVEPGDGGETMTPPGVPVEAIVTERRVTTYTVPESDGADRLYTYVPLEPSLIKKLSKSPKPSLGTLEISSVDTTSRDRFQRSLVRSAMAMFSVTLLSAAVILIGGIRMVGKPLDRLIDKVRRVGEGDFGGPVELKQRDELGKLGSAINQMCMQLESQREKINEATSARLRTEGQLRHADRLSTLGRLAAGVAHELGTPLNVVSGRAELIAGGDLSPEETKRSATAIKHESDRITKIIRSLMDFSRRGTSRRHPTSINGVIEQTVLLMRPLAEKRRIQLTWTPMEHDVTAEIDAGQIQQVFTNLIVNALGAIDRSGVLSITGERRQSIAPLIRLNDDLMIDEASHELPKLPIETVCISVSDDGHGIDKQHLESIFEPFFTTKEVGEGTGLGLSIAHGIIEDHEGWIEVTSDLNEGTTFDVYLPLQSSDDEDGPPFEMQPPLIKLTDQQTEKPINHGDNPHLETK